MRENAKLNEILFLLKKGLLQMSKLDDSIVKLQADVSALTVANKAAVALLASVPGKIASAVADALAAGATPSQLQSLSDLSAAVEGDTADLVAASTPPAPAPAA